MTWKPNDFIRLVALIGGFVLFGVGAWMLFKGISAEGFVDLKSTLLSGTIKAASAGLYLCFFAMFIIAIVLVTIMVPARRETSGAISYHQRLIQVFWGLLFSLAACTIGEVVVGGVGFSWVIGLLGSALIFVVLAILRD